MTSVPTITLNDARARALDRERARRLRVCLSALNAAAEAMDGALDLLATTADAMHAVVDEANRFGVVEPTHHDLDALCRRRYRRGPPNRETFTALFAAWSTLIERRIAELEHEEAA
jgi:hypothetical protein